LSEYKTTFWVKGTHRQTGDPTASLYWGFAYS
jgi:hypothetical protein